MKTLTLLFAVALLGSAQQVVQMGKPMPISNDFMNGDDFGLFAYEAGALNITLPTGGSATVDERGVVALKGGAQLGQVITALSAELISEHYLEQFMRKEHERQTKASDDKLKECKAGFDLALDAYRLLRMAISEPTGTIKDTKHDDKK